MQRQRLLVQCLGRGGDGEQVRFLERLANPLQTDGEPASLAARHAHAREAREVQAHGVDVAEVNCHRVGLVHAALERESRHRGACNHVAAFESLVEVVGDEAAHLLCLHVVGIVEAGAKNVASEEDAALHFLAETFAAGLGVQVEQLAGFLAAVAVTHAVVTGKVRACFGSGDDVVARYGETDVREAHFLERGAFGFELLQHVFR